MTSNPNASQRFNQLPLVYSCSGCSNLAQMANQIAINLDRSKQAEMSCIAGVGGKIPHLVKLAKSERPILAIDGCPLACTQQCLALHHVKPTYRLILSELGFKKQYHKNFVLDELNYAQFRAEQLLSHEKSNTLMASC